MSDTPNPATEPARPHPTKATLLLLGTLTAYGAVTIDLYLPGMPAIGRSLGVDSGAVQHTMAAFFIGMALGQMIYGPLSDRIGRRPLLLFGAAVYVAASLLCALAPSIEWLVAGRFVQALGACSGVVLARAIVRDRFDHQDSARIFSLLMLVLGIAPILAPTLGGWLVGWVGWRGIFGALAAFGVATFVAVALWLPESRSAATAELARNEHVGLSYAAMLRNPRFLGFLLTGAFNGATLFVYISNAPDLLIDQLGFDIAQFGWLFALLAVAVIGSGQVNRMLLDHIPSMRILHVASAVGVVIGIVLLGVAASGVGGRWLLLAVLFAALASYSFIATNTTAAALSVDPQRAGTASALIGAGSFAMGALASLLAGALHDGTPLPMAAIMAGALTLSALALFGLARPAARA
jgi:DHA1 family bicyclomycin/chloramphenicol resistance-like MFS transporter